MEHSIIFEKSFLGMDCKCYKRVIDLKDDYSVVKYTDKYQSFFKKVNGELVEVLYLDEYKDLLNKETILLYKDFYIVKDGSNIEKELTKLFIEEKKKMRNFMNGLLYNSLEDLSKFNMCKTYINEIKNQSNMSDFFKRRLEGILIKNQELIISSI